MHRELYLCYYRTNTSNPRSHQHYPSLSHLQKQAEEREKQAKEREAAERDNEWLRQRLYELEQAQLMTSSGLTTSIATAAPSATASFEPSSGRAVPVAAAGAAAAGGPASSAATAAAAPSLGVSDMGRDLGGLKLNSMNHMTVSNSGSDDRSGLEGDGRSPLWEAPKVTHSALPDASMGGQQGMQGSSAAGMVQEQGLSGQQGRGAAAADSMAGSVAGRVGAQGVNASTGGAAARSGGVTSTDAPDEVRKG